MIGGNRLNIIEEKSKRHFEWMSLATQYLFSLFFNQAKQPFTVWRPR
jgi:hypothetical protein